MTDDQRGGQQRSAHAARMHTAGRWVAGHGVEEALVAVPAAAAVALPAWWAQLPAAAAAVVAAGLWVRHEWRTRRRVRQADMHRVPAAATAAAITSSDETDIDGPGPAQREVSIHG